MPINRASRRSVASTRAAIRHAACLTAVLAAVTVLPALVPATAEAQTPAHTYSAGVGAPWVAGPRKGYLTDSNSSDSDTSSGDKGSDAKSSDDKGSDTKSSDDKGADAKTSDEKGSEDKAGTNSEGKAAKSGEDDPKSSEAGPADDTAGSKAAETATDDKTGSAAAGPIDGKAADPGATAPAAGTPAQPFAGAAEPVVRQVKIEPGDQTVPVGEKVVFTAKYSGPAGASVTIRWQTTRGHGGSWTDVDGGSGAEMQTTAATDMDGAQFRVEVSGGDHGDGAVKSEPVTSDPVTLHVTTPVSPRVPAEGCPATGHTAEAIPADQGKSEGKSEGKPDQPAPGREKSEGEARHSDSPAADGKANSAECPGEASDAASYGTVADQTIALGQEQTAVGHNFAPGARVKVTVEPDGIDLGTTQAAPDGTVTTRFDTSRLLAGEHTVTWTPVAP